MFVDWFQTAYQILARILLRIILVFIGDLEISGRENIPAKGPYIIITNHLSKLDAPLILIAFPRKRIRVFAASKWQKHPFFGPILGLSGAIWVKRGEVDRKALGDAMTALSKGQVIGMSPEGTRSRTRELHKARQGPAYISSRAKVPILPVGIVNTDCFQENIHRLKRTHFKIIIGKPINLPELDHRPRSNDLQAFTTLLMVHIAHLLPERYRGYYAENAGLAAIKAGDDPWPFCLEMNDQP